MIMSAEKIILEAFQTDDDIHLPDKVMQVVTGDVETRNRLYMSLIMQFNGDLSYDWFQRFYEERYAQRKDLKQDFTPPQVCSLLSRLTEGNTVHEPTAGNGGILIAQWWEATRKTLAWDYRPSQHMVDCWELSYASLPFLLFNLSIRGMMGYVTLGDVLTLQPIRRYALLNRFDDAMSFSEVIEIGTNDRIERKLK